MTEVRVNRLTAILWALLDCGRAGGCTRTQIADMLQLKKTPYITELLRQMVRDGWAVETMNTAIWPHRYHYTPSQKTLDWEREQTSQSA